MRNDEAFASIAHRLPRRPGEADPLVGGNAGPWLVCCARQELRAFFLFAWPSIQAHALHLVPRHLDRGDALIRDLINPFDVPAPPFTSVLPSFLAFSRSTARKEADVRHLRRAN